MTEELFDLLRRKGLTDRESVEGIILESYTLSQVIELDHQLSEIVERECRTPVESEPAGFDLFPNDAISAGRSSCWDSECRLERADSLARFAVLWSDSVLLQPYFGYADADSEHTTRSWLAGSLKALVTSEPAFRAQIIKFAPQGFGFCATHGAQFQIERNEVEQRLRQAKEALYYSYSEQFKGSVCLHENSCHVSIDRPTELFPHPGAGFELEGSPNWLPKRLRSGAHSARHQRRPLSKRPIAKSGLVDVAIDKVMEDILWQHFMCRMLGTMYLTNRKADTVFLNALNDNDNFSGWNEVLSQYIRYEMPILTGVPLHELIEFRAHDYEAFQVYRDTMKQVIGKHISNRPAITGAEAKDIYDDVIRPELNKMNLKLKSIRDKLSSKLRRDAIISGGIVILGLSSGLAFPPLALSAGAAIPSAIGAAKSALERRDASDELKSDNLYFLWKASQKSARN